MKSYGKKKKLLLIFPVRYSRQFRFEKNKVHTELVCNKFSNYSVFFTPYCRARKDLSEKVWVVALIVYRFRDKRENTKYIATYRPSNVLTFPSQVIKEFRNLGGG